MVSIPWYCKGELRSRIPTLGFWWSTLHCPQKSVISRYSWKPAHCHSFVFIAGWCNCCCVVRGPWSHPQFCANRSGEDAPTDSDGAPHDTIPCYYWWLNNWFISSQAQQLLYWCHWPPLRSSWRLNVTSCSPARCFRCVFHPTLHPVKYFIQ